MIDLERNRRDLLAEIEATEATGEPLNDVTQLRAAGPEAHVRVQGKGKAELFALLSLALSERFPSVPRLQLIRDLLIPLRSALGNAYKHANQRDTAKTVSVEVVSGPDGALLAVTSQGSGFDVAEALRRFQEEENHCEGRGVGFRAFHQALSTVSFENEGRTFLLCFRPGRMERRVPALPDGPSAFRQIWSSALLREAQPPAEAPDAASVQVCLSAEVPEFSNGEARIESCRAYAKSGPAHDACGNRYVLRVARQNGQPAGTWILTGRFHDSEAAAAADFEAARRLHDAALASRWLVPRPVARPASEPRLVLYDFHPWLNLWEYLSYHRRGLKSLCHAAERAGQALAALHRSRIGLPGVETHLSGEEIRSMATRAQTNVRTVAGGPVLTGRLAACVEPLQDWAASSRQLTVAPIHGGLGWDCIQFGVDGRFYLSRFENCRLSDPGLDLGGFAADLRCFTLSRHEGDTYDVCLEALLNHYNSRAEHPINAADLPFYIALALFERLGRTAVRSKADAEKWVEALEAVLAPRETVASLGLFRL